MKYDARDYWDDRALRWDTRRLYRYPLEEHELLDWFRSKFAEGSKTVIELGPGIGRGFLTLVDAGMQRENYTAVDISAKMSERMFELTGVQPLIWDGENLPFDDRSFDLLLSYDVTLHVEPDKIGNHISEMLRVVKDSAYIVTYSGDRTSFHSFSHDYPCIFNKLGYEWRSVRFEDDRVHYIVKGACL